MKTSDIQVFKGDELNRQFFDAPVSVCRFDDPSGDGEWVNVTFSNGGQMSVFTTTPIVFVEPERN
jgi:hypothetical protein